ncbi:MAG: helix-turn-helix transcriptional regulator, partial [Bacteroidota bacterium]
MSNINDFFSVQNTVRNVSDSDKEQTSSYLECIKAFAKLTYMSVYVIDYEKKGFEYVSDNPLFLCGHTAQEVQNFGYAFYFKYVTPEDLDLLLKINKAGFDFYEDIAIEKRKDYVISYDFHLKNNNGNVVLINQKLTPLFLNSEGKIWKALCIISLSNEQTSGNVKIYEKG